MEAPTRRTASMKKADMKVVLLGDMDVGKTSLVLRYIDRKFQDTVSTIGASFLLKQWGHYNIAIWDTAGEEKYHGLNAFYCRNTSAAILVFDLTNLRTFEALRLRYLPLLETVDSDVLKIVVGSKLDLFDKAPRQVSSEMGHRFALEINGCVDSSSKNVYFETSSLTGTGVDRVFESVFDNFFPSKGSQPRPSSQSSSGYQHTDAITLNSQEKREKGNSCCWMFMKSQRKQLEKCGLRTYKKDLQL